jgi:hypothetical protein
MSCYPCFHAKTCRGVFLIENFLISLYFPKSATMLAADALFAGRPQGVLKMDA